MQCTLCKSSEKDDVMHGEFLRKGRVAVHYYCLLLTTVMEQNGDDDEGIRGFLVPDIVECAEKSKNKKCTYCRGTGANIACCNRKCFRFFHTVCGAKNNARYIFYDTFQSFCHRHIDLPDDRNPHDPEELCSICCDTLGTYHPLNSIRPPCCSSGWFHRLCLARAALSAGYFFRCPLCNEEKTFRNFLTHRNVFIPDRDAAWELAPRAFSELERKLFCSADKCVCPTGRNTNANHWKMRICIVCGSKAIHMNCNKFYLHRRYTCEDCDHTLHSIEKSKCPEGSNENEEVDREERFETETVDQTSDDPSTLQTVQGEFRENSMEKRVLRSRTRSLHLENRRYSDTGAPTASSSTDSLAMDNEFSKANEEDSHGKITRLTFKKEWSCKVQPDAPQLSPRKRARSMFDGNPESRDSDFSDNRIKTRSGNIVEPRRRSLRLVERLSISEDSAENEINNDQKGHRNETITSSNFKTSQSTSSTLTVISKSIDEISNSATATEADDTDDNMLKIHDSNQNETLLDQPKLTLRKRTSAVVRESFSDNDSIASEESTIENQKYKGATKGGTRRSRSRNSQGFTKELLSIPEDESEMITKNESSIEISTQNHGDTEKSDKPTLEENNCQVPEESNLNNDLEASESISSTVNQTPEREASAKPKRILKRRKRLVVYESSSDDDSPAKEEIASEKTIALQPSSGKSVRPKTNRKNEKSLKSQKLITHYFTKMPSPIIEEVSQEITEKESHHTFMDTNEDTELTDELPKTSSPPTSSSFDEYLTTATTSTATLNSICIDKSPESDEDMLESTEKCSKYPSESEVSPPKRVFRKRTRSIFDELSDDSIPLKALFATNDEEQEDSDSSIHDKKSSKLKKYDDQMHQDVFTEDCRRSYRLEKQQTPIITQKLAPVALSEPDMRVLNNRNRPCRKAALCSRIRTFKMCDYFNAQRD